MQTYNTLDQALADIARRSFYQDATITPTNVDGHTEYVVDDSCTGREELIYWTYEQGAELPSPILDWSRVHEPCEYYDNAGHIRYNLSNAVEALEEGDAVSFQYVQVDKYCDDDCTELDEFGSCCEDHTVGWALLAYSEETD